MKNMQIKTTLSYAQLVFASLPTTHHDKGNHRAVKQKKNQRKIVIIVLSISINMCFGCSKEPSQ